MVKKDPIGAQCESLAKAAMEWLGSGNAGTSKAVYGLKSSSKKKNGEVPRRMMTKSTKFKVDEVFSWKH